MQEEPLLYSEQQPLRQLWVWLIVLPGPAIIFWVLVKHILPGSDPMSGLALTLLYGTIGLLPPILIYCTILYTEVRGDAVYVRLRPFHRKWVEITFDSISEAEPITYRALRDYGGWGIRYGRGGKAYNISGNQGVMLSLKDGRKIMIGSRTHEVLTKAISERIALV